MELEVKLGSGFDVGGGTAADHGGLNCGFWWRFSQLWLLDSRFRSPVRRLPESLKQGPAFPAQASLSTI